MKIPSNRLVGMIHAGALPGTPFSCQTVSQVAEAAAREAELLADAGFECLLLENMHDRPYLRRDVGPEIVAAMTTIALTIRRATGLPLGIQILAGANREAIAVAQAAECSFIRAEGFVFGHVADEGLLQSDAGELLRYRKLIGAEKVAIYTDIKKKHSSHAVTADVSLAETAKAAEFFAADGVVVTGTSTGEPTSTDDVKAVRGATALPILVGSGVTPEGIGALWPHADMFIVGSWIKTGGRWNNPVDPARAGAMVEAARRLVEQAGRANQS